MSGWLPPGCTDKDIDDAAPQNDPDDAYPLNRFQDEYAALKEREDRRKYLRRLGEEAIKEDRLWFTCWLSVTANDLGWECIPPSLALVEKDET